MFSPKQHSALFWHCEVSERICPARTVPETTVALTVVEKRRRHSRLFKNVHFLPYLYLGYVFITLFNKFNYFITNHFITYGRSYFIPLSSPKAILSPLLQKGESKGLG